MSGRRGPCFVRSALLAMGCAFAAAGCAEPQEDLGEPFAAMSASGETAETTGITSWELYVVEDGIAIRGFDEYGDLATDMRSIEVVEESGGTTWEWRSLVPDAGRVVVTSASQVIEGFTSDEATTIGRAVVNDLSAHLQSAAGKADGASWLQRCKNACHKRAGEWQDDCEDDNGDDCGDEADDREDRCKDKCSEVASGDESSDSDSDSDSSSGSDSDSDSDSDGGSKSLSGGRGSGGYKSPNECHDRYWQRTWACLGCNTGVGALFGKKCGSGSDCESRDRQYRAAGCG